MKRILPYLLATALLICSCGRRTRLMTDAFDRPDYTPRYASGFDISGSREGRSTLIRIRDPWQGASGVEQRLLIVRDDEPLPAGYEGPAVKVPVRRAVCMSSSHVAMFDALGEIRRVKGVSGIDYLSNAYVQEHRRCGEVRDVGPDSNPDYELLTALRPDIVLLYGVTGENTALTGKLRELGIPYLYIGDYVEQSPLGKAEWMLVVAELCDCPERGAAVFDWIAGSYRATAERVAARTAALPDSLRRPLVLLNTPYRDTWFLPSPRNYMAQLIRDAGGRTFCAADSTGNASRPIDMEEAYLLASEADYWLNAGSFDSRERLIAQYPKFAKIPAVTGRRVYNNNRRRTPAGGSDFWESGAVRPDLILNDLVAILHPEPGDTTLCYYRQLE